ncbi:MAG: class I SAM-dependent methyltransferase [Tolypothrix carrinoi HA7290-LM1]|nr:class I SAM-dependent methyltransferase [Tolypothrix carrinoi HA7290-LM1]
MIINLLDGKIEYKQSANTERFFAEMVKKPFDEHPQTEAWQKEVLQSYINKDFQKIRAIVGGGQADFDTPFRGLTPKERVLVYCNRNMQQHVVSQKYLFEKHKDIFDKYIFDPNTKLLFIDFGCGPLTSGIALALHYAKSAKNSGEKINFNYIGMDKAKSMLEKASEFSLYSGLFHSNTTFQFFNTYANYSPNFIEVLCDYIDNHISDKTLIVLNFSYLFASPSLKVDRLISFVKNLLNKYLYKEVCLIFQNPQGINLNKNWHFFQNQVLKLKTKINGARSDTFEYFDLHNQGLRETKLFYDILFR